MQQQECCSGHTIFMQLPTVQLRQAERARTADNPAELEPAKEEHEDCGAVGNVKDQQQVDFCFPP